LYLPICSFRDDRYELNSYGLGVAQLGSAGALGSYLFTNKTYCNKILSYFYYILKGGRKRQNFSCAGADQ
tara:strand:+ start:146 stop:355 length:210 start_codon:yes stop_codon:yes gene_type:complete